MHIGVNLCLWCLWFNSYSILWLSINNFVPTEIGCVKKISMKPHAGRHTK